MGVLTAKQAKEEESVYSDYYDFSEPIPRLKGHRILALHRGETEEFLKVAVEMDEDKAKAALGARVITNKKSPVTERLVAIVADAYDRLLFPSLEREIRNDLFDNACEGALVVFSDNLRHLLMDCPAKIHVRVPLIPQFNTPEQQSATAAALGALGAENIELFSYVLREK